MDLNDMINQNRNIYTLALPKQQLDGKISQRSMEDGSQTIDHILSQNKQFYNPIDDAVIVGNQIQLEEEPTKFDFFDIILKSTKVPEVKSLKLLYNYKTIIKHEGIPLEDVQKLDHARLERKKRNQKDSGLQEDQVPSQQKKKYIRIYKNYLTRLYYSAPKTLRLISYNLQNGQKWVKQLNIQDFGNMRPSMSIIQEQTTGRFYIYDNSCGKVHIYSSDMLNNPNKDKPLVSLNLNEQPPRQDPLLYLIECEHEYQWKSVLFVIGGYHSQRELKRPLRTIKVFEIKRREVTLTPTLTINMQYPRMSPIVFDLSKSKGMYWQDTDQMTKIESLQKSIEEKYIFFMGGNALNDYENSQLDPELKSANQTCEYVQLKLILEHIARAKQFLQVDQNQVSLGLNFGKYQIVDTLNIKYQNGQLPEKLQNHFHHASVVKIQDEVFDSSQCLIILGGGSTQTLKLQFINQTMNEIIFMSNKLQLDKPANIWSASNLRYFKSIYYFDDSNQQTPQILQNMDSRGRIPGKTTCTCTIQ